MTGRDGSRLSGPSTRGEIDSFLKQVARTPAVRPAGGPRGRLVFAMDATASREPTWDMASDLQAEMFEATADIGGLDVQLVHYGGFGAFQASPWVGDPRALLERMGRVRCLGGRTQIGRVLSHTLAETRDRKVNALVFVGDCMEEDLDSLAHTAGELGLRGTPAFLFHEGNDSVAIRAFDHLARLTGGACCRFDAGSARQLRELLGAVAVFAAGGRKALADYGARTGGAAKLLTSRLPAG